MKDFTMSAAALLLVFSLAVVGQPEMHMGRLDELQVLEAMELNGNITRVQLETIADLIEERDHSNVPKNGNPQMRTSRYKAEPTLLSDYLRGEVDGGKLPQQTFRYIMQMFHLRKQGEEAAFLNPVASNYDLSSQGTVDLVSTYSTIRTFVWTGLRLGIWGYATGKREYVLQSTWAGLRIIDITISWFPYEVQFIYLSPFDAIWRDVVTYAAANGKTYAYVHAQGSNIAGIDLGTGELYVVDLSALPGGSWPNWLSFIGLGPIWSSAVKKISGFSDLGHTIHQEDGLLFVNSATFGDGTLVFDLEPDPWNPVQIGHYRAGEGHDVAYRTLDVNGLGPRQVLIVSDANQGEHRLLDLTDLRQDFATSGAVVDITFGRHLLGETNLGVMNYAHSNVVTDDGTIMYVCDESNLFDIAIFDISDVRNPQLVRYMQWSGETEDRNSVVHNLHIRGQYLLAAYYEVGFRVFDISDARNPVEVGNYETFRDPWFVGQLLGAPTGEYLGAWNLYADFPSGKIAVSDMFQGTFVFRLDESRR